MQYFLTPRATQSAQRTREIFIDSPADNFETSSVRLSNSNLLRLPEIPHSPAKSVRGSSINDLIPQVFEKVEATFLAVPEKVRNVRSA